VSRVRVRSGTVPPGKGVRMGYKILACGQGLTRRKEYRKVP
jgi:hypothetical protein